MPFARNSDLSVYFERGGAGQPLLFISGTGSDLRNKPNQFDSPLAESFELICYDQRGLGQTGNPDGDFTMAQYADDAVALLDHLGLEQVPVMGVSFGGMVAQELLIRHPDRVSVAVLACTSSGGAGGASFPLHEIAHLEPRQRAITQLKTADLQVTDEWIAEYPDKFETRLAMALNNVRSDRDEDGAMKQLLARAAHDTYDRLPQIEHPVLLAGGEFDGIAPVANMQAMAAQMANSELKMFAGGHMFLIQDRAAYPYIIQWLESRLG